MVTQVENELLIGVGPGTPLGSLMREYWIPVIRSAQIEAGAPPVRVKILGENFVAYRTPSGQAGFMDEACPHRGASMMLACNEEGGLRCVYHGWKIAPEGAVVDAPTHPEDTPLDRLRSRAHPVVEKHGIVWSWLGKEAPAAFPQLVISDLAEDQVVAANCVINCSWLHPLETLWDVFHAQILHNQTNRKSMRSQAYFGGQATRKAGNVGFNYPEMTVQRTDYGFTYVNSDVAKETQFQFVLPFTQFHAVTPGPNDDRAFQMSVPIDDEHCLLWMVFYNKAGPLKPDGFAWQGLGKLSDLGDMLHSFPVRTPENRWGQDRAAMARGESFSGFEGPTMLETIMGEDVGMIESQGRADRSRDTLGPVDRALVEGRNTVLAAIRAYEKDGTVTGRGLDLRHVEADFRPKPAMAAE